MGRAKKLKLSALSRRKGVVAFRRQESAAAKVSEAVNTSDAVSTSANSATGDDQQSPILGTVVWLLCASGLIGTMLWAYWPTLRAMVRTWDTIPDYSHGYLVVPAALLFLWVRRDRIPAIASRPQWLGLLLIGLAIAVRYASARWYIDALDGWSIPLWVAGTVWVLGGWRMLWWAAPSVAFLWFMVPLPWRVERWLSLPLQKIATKASCWTLQMLGQPALAEGNVIRLHDMEIEVAEACSGLRIFMGIAALAFAYLVLVRRQWWERLLLVVATVPVALIANATRIVVTGLLSQWASGEAARRFSHDWCGYLMIPYAALLFALVLWYLGRLVQTVEIVDVAEALRREKV
jgi:exosortase